MRKLSFILLLFFPFIIVAQFKLQNGVRVKGDYFVKPDVNSQSKALGNVIWFNNFDQPTDWIIDNDGQTNPGFGWSIDSNVDANWWYANGINSTSGGNFAEVGNGNYDNETQAVGVNYYLTLASPIDLTTLGTEDFVISFQQAGARFNDFQELQISTDGVNFSTVYSNNTQRVFDGVRVDDAYENPHLVSLRIDNEIIDSNPSNVIIRFYWSSAYSSNEAPYAWSTYGWFIDDLKFSELPDNDLAILDFNWGYNDIPYYTIPEETLDTLTFQIKVVNQGKNDLSGVVFELDINDGDSIIQTAGIDLNSFDTSFFSIKYFPHIDTMKFKPIIYSDSLDDLIDNNIIDSISDVLLTHYYNGYLISYGVYSRSEYRQGGSVGGPLFQNGNQIQAGFELGNIFEVNRETYACWILTHLDESITNIGQEIYAILYLYDTLSGEYNFVAQTDFHQIQPSDVGSQIEFYFDQSILLSQEEVYFAAVGVSSAVTFNFSGTSNPNTSFLSYGTMANSIEVVSMAQTPSVDIVLHDNPCILSLAEDSNNDVNSLKNYPNPFLENTSITFELVEPTVIELIISDLSGRIISQESLGKLGLGYHQYLFEKKNLDSGLYNYTIQSEKSKITKRMILLE